ncbi:hypothetical protein [Variovorax paradoxus]|uniref:hypothetical protein n=1 Tax=Variovorax paradoxus TaxID=34073 RepID=UPI001ABC3D0D
MNLMSRLSADGRARKRLREARAEIRRAERAVRRRQRVASPGYGEIRRPWFLLTMAAAVVVLFFDLRPVLAVLGEWVQLTSFVFFNLQEIANV